MSTYLERVQQQSEAQVANKIADHDNTKAQKTAGWRERLTPLEDRLAKLLVTIPLEIKDMGLSLSGLQGMLTGKWRGKCHPGELGAALRKLGYSRRRNWSARTQSFSALWFKKEN